MLALGQVCGVLEGEGESAGIPEGNGIEGASADMGRARSPSNLSVLVARYV